jgi:hypothetical protein
MRVTFDIFLFGSKRFSKPINGDSKKMLKKKPQMYEISQLAINAKNLKNKN